MNNNMKVGMASDHAGFELKAALKEYLSAKGYEVFDYGTDSGESVDYPDFAHPLADAVLEVKTHEKLKEKEFRQFMADEAAKESKEIDELVSYRFGQKEDE